MSQTSIRELAELPPQQLALVCIDFQNDFCHSAGKCARLGITQNEAAASRADQVARRILHGGGHVIYTQQLVDKAQLTERQARWESDDGLCVQGSWGAELYLPPPEGAHVVSKSRFDVWQSDHFLALLGQLGVDGLILAGVELRCCLLFGVVGADERGYRYCVPQDLVAGVDAGEETYNRSVREYLRTVHDAPDSVEQLLDMRGW